MYSNSEVFHPEEEKELPGLYDFRLGTQKMRKQIYLFSSLFLCKFVSFISLGITFFLCKMDFTI